MSTSFKSRLVLVALMKLALSGVADGSRNKRDTAAELGDDCADRDILECLREQTLQFQFPPVPSSFPPPNPSLPANPSLPPTNPSFPPPNPSVPNPFPPNPSFPNPFPPNPFPFPNPSFPNPFPPPNPSFPNPFPPPNPSFPNPFPPPNPSIPNPFPPPNPSFPNPFPPPNPSLPNPFPPPNPSLPNPFPSANPSLPFPSAGPSPSVPLLVVPAGAEVATVQDPDVDGGAVENTQSASEGNHVKSPQTDALRDGEIANAQNRRLRREAQENVGAVTGGGETVDKIPWWNKRSVEERVGHQQLKQSLLQLLRGMVEKRYRRAAQQSHWFRL